MSVALTAAMLAAVIALAGEPKEEHGAAAGGETTTTTPAATTPAKPPPPAGDAAAGKTLFTAQGCVACHTFKPAGATAKVGPDLDNLAADAEKANRGTVEEYAAESIEDPTAYTVPGLPERRDALVQLAERQAGRRPGRLPHRELGPDACIIRRFSAVGRGTLASRMVELGYALSSEELPAPSDLVAVRRRAEEAGFALRARLRPLPSVARRPGREPVRLERDRRDLAGDRRALTLGTGVTCPTMRIHPAIVAQAAATSAQLMPGRFFLGVGTGENLNEHVLGDRWPGHEERLEMLEEAIERDPRAVGGRAGHPPRPPLHGRPRAPLLAAGRAAADRGRRRRAARGRAGRTRRRRADRDRTRPGPRAGVRAGRRRRASRATGS